MIRQQILYIVLMEITYFILHNLKLLTGPYIHVQKSRSKLWHYLPFNQRLVKQCCYIYNIHVSVSISNFSRHWEFSIFFFFFQFWVSNPESDFTSQSAIGSFLSLDTNKITKLKVIRPPLGLVRHTGSVKEPIYPL